MAEFPLHADARYALDGAARIIARFVIAGSRGGGERGRRGPSDGPGVAAPAKDGLVDRLRNRRPLQKGGRNPPLGQGDARISARWRGRLCGADRSALGYRKTPLRSDRDGVQRTTSISRPTTTARTPRSSTSPSSAWTSGSAGSRRSPSGRGRPLWSAQPGGAWVVLPHERLPRAERRRHARRRAAYPIASSSSIMRSITERPIVQKPGSFASRPNGASSSE